MKKGSKFLPAYGVLLVLVFLVFKSWLGSGEISAGDAAFYFKENLTDISILPTLWPSYTFENYTGLLGSYFYLFSLPSILARLNLPWFLIERLVWYFPFLFLGIYSPWFLAKSVFPNLEYKFFSPLVFLFNTYSLMIIGGGQISVALSYAIAPLVLALLINLNKKRNLKLSVLAGLVLAAQIGFEPRIALITLVVFVFYSVMFVQIRLYHFVAFITALLLHSFWVLPTVLVRASSIDPSLTKEDWVSFLSFAHFSDSFSLLHPNWPENIFGKTYFFRPEFLLIPILVFSGLFLINRLQKKVFFFYLLALFGAFLSKGVNPPFGEIYQWLFEKLPGMNLFRDPTKFYLLVSLSYSLLIPFSVSHASYYLEKRYGSKLAKIFVFVSFCSLLLLMKGAWTGRLGGTFKAREVPQEYVEVKNFLINQKDFFRVLWVPKLPRYGFYSNNHPAVNSESLLSENDCLKPFCSLKTEMSLGWGKECSKNDRCYVRELSYFLNPQTAEVLSNMSVKYVIVPLDKQGEIFVANHEYNVQQRQEVESFFDTVPWLKKMKMVDKIAIYELQEPKDCFYLDSHKNSKLNWQMANPTKYLVSVNIENVPETLVFCKSYHPSWQVRIGNKVVLTEPYKEQFNGFSLDQKGDWEVIVEFPPQRYVYWGLIVSLLTFLAVVVIMVYR